MKNLARGFQFMLCIASASVLAGCGGGESSNVNKLPTVPVKGSVMLDGASPGEVLLEFRPAGQSAPTASSTTSSARVNADGSFVVKTYEDADGAPPGKYVVHMLPLDATASPAKQAKPLEVEIENKPEGVELSLTLESAGAAVDPLLSKPR